MKCKGNNRIDNFRLITLLSSLAKILEKIVKERLLSFLNLNNFFSPNQYGFLKKKGTESAMITLLTKINTSINLNKKFRW